MFLRSTSNVVLKSLHLLTPSTPVNTMQSLSSRQFSSTSLTAKMQPLLTNAIQSSYSFPNVWMKITGGFAATGAVKGGLSLWNDGNKIERRADLPPIWFQHFFKFGTGAAVGTAFGGLYGAFLAIPLAYAVKYPLAGVMMVTGAAAHTAYTHRQKLFGASQNTQASNPPPAKSKSVSSRWRP